MPKTSAVHAILGPMDSSVVEIVSLLSKYDKIPVLSYGASMAKLSRKDVSYHASSCMCTCQLLDTRAL